MPAYT